MTSTRPIRRAKILATLGPSSANPDILGLLIDAGLSAVRLNFSHSTQPEHAATIAMIRRVAEEKGVPLPIVQDLQGPKIRIGSLPGGKGALHQDSIVRFTVEKEREGKGGAIFVDYEGFASDVQRGHRFLVNDGLLEFEAIASDGKTVEARVIRAGTLYDHNGINLPGTDVSLPPLSEKDILDLRFGLSAGVDAVAMSFVRRPEDLELARIVMHDAGRIVPIFAKIETPAAVENLEAIAAQADGLLVARGDLGVELPPEKVPAIQKRIIEIGSRRGIPVITATQMLESMMDHARPTRAEASDVANAIFDGSDCVMLSGETARGEFPVEAVSMMDRIIREAESESKFIRKAPGIDVVGEADVIPEAVGGAAAFAADRVGARAIVCFTLTGTMARLLSAYRPRVPIIAVTPTIESARPLGLVWGVVPVVSPRNIEDHEEFVEAVDAILVPRGIANPGELVILLMGSPPSERPRTNLMRIHRVRPTK